ncbi:unnamed protein product [Brassica rapa subsp. narinosa]
MMMNDEIVGRRRWKKKVEDAVKLILSLSHVLNS